MTLDDKNILTSQGLLSLIEKHGGASGLDISGRDLTGINLDYVFIQTKKKSCAKTPVWYSPVTKGLNLKGASLKNVNLTKAQLGQVDLTESSLYGATLNNANFHDSVLQDCSLIEIDSFQANFSYCNMSGCYLNRAKLFRADFSNAKLYGTDLTYADLTFSKLVNARLIDVDMRHAILNMVDFYGAVISNTYLSQGQIGKHIIQETKEYAGIKDRFIQAVSVYRALKNNFISIGNYEDASWAYVKERQIRRKTHNLFRVKDNYQEEYFKLQKRGVKRPFALINFYIGHMLKYITDWFFEISCKYGESPLQAIYFSLFVILIFSLLYFLSGFSSLNDYLESLNHSIKSFISVNNINGVKPIIQILTTIESLFGLLMISLLMFSVGNRIKRS